MNTNLTKLTLIAILTFGLGSCYKEDMSDCSGNVRLTLRLADDVITRSLARLGEFDITGARVWAFDSSGDLVKYRCVGSSPTEEYEIAMNLPAGNYNFVVWTGDGSVYKYTSDASRADAMELYLDHDGDTVTENIPDLLYGMKSGCSVVAGEINDIEVVMHPNTYNINITATGLTGSDDTWEVAVADNNSHYTFDDRIVYDTGELRYLRQGTLTDAAEFRAFIRTLTLTSERHPRFTLRNVSTGRIFYDGSLTRTIVDAYAANGRTADFDHVYTYDIRLKFGGGGTPGNNGDLAVTISVNGWEHDHEPTDLQ